MGWWFYFKKHGINRSGHTLTVDDDVLSPVDDDLMLALTLSGAVVVPEHRRFRRRDLVENPR